MELWSSCFLLVEYFDSWRVREEGRWETVGEQERGNCSCLHVTVPMECIKCSLFVSKKKSKREKRLKCKVFTVLPVLVLQTKKTDIDTCLQTVERKT